MKHRLPALLLLIALIFRISFGWAGVPGTCHHAQPAQPAAQTEVDAPPCHAPDDAAPCHGTQGGDDCDCGCCHVAAAMVSLGMTALPTSHLAAIAASPPVDLTYTPTPAHRPPIA